MSRRFLPPLVLAALFVSRPARADVPVRALVEAMDQAERASGAPGTGSARSALATLPTIIRSAPGSMIPLDAGVLPVAPGFAVVQSSVDEVRRLAADHPDWSLLWSPPRRFLLDRAVPSTGAVSVRNDTGLTGRGVAIGVVDTGLDLTHPDMRNADGTTRVEWFVDLGASPLGVHGPAEALCAAANIDCAVYGRAEIDLALQNGIELPTDSVGHGTHVASIAASNGLSATPPQYIGVAPEATLVVARANTGLAITDVDVFTAVRVLYFLVEDYAEMLGSPVLPMVTNLSLGSDFGPHDGTSALGAGLAEMVGEDHPGRVIVVAAGNSGGVFVASESAYPNPFGIHANVHVAGELTRVPIITPESHSGVPTTRGQVATWIEMGEGERLSVGFDRGNRQLLRPVPPGDVRGAIDGTLTVTIVNGARDELPLLPTGRPGAVVIVEGSWASGEVFAIRLEGSGTADLWVLSAGDAGPEVSLGALVPAATKEGTINIPAAHPDLIAVGATLNRLDWVDSEGERVTATMTDFETPRVDSTVYFSSAGPSVNGSVKPDVVAPGASIIAAMSAAANPFENPATIFSATGCSPLPGCAVVDAAHAVSSGSSMAAPVVSGAVALMLEQDPTLTQREAQRLLQAGARALEGNVRIEQQVGAGAIDLARIMQAIEERAEPVGRVPGTGSRIVLARSFVEPDGSRPVRGLVQTRDDAGDIADGFDERRLRLDASPATGAAELVQEGPGLWSFAVAAPAGSGGLTMSLRLSYGDGVIAETTLPIAVDASVAKHGFFAEGGCAMAGATRRGRGEVWVVAALVWLARRRTPCRTQRHALKRLSHAHLPALGWMARSCDDKLHGH